MIVSADLLRKNRRLGNLVIHRKQLFLHVNFVRFIGQNALFAREFAGNTFKGHRPFLVDISPRLFQIIIEDELEAGYSVIKYANAVFQNAGPYIA
ncbi:hypothetical protein AH578_003143 [Salmonella enterica subsp. enterica]|nr:hypothetical protein [Salmonella enterica subsp. enterica serovar Chincol]